MKILADESVDKAIIQKLRKEGHSVVYNAMSFRMPSDNIMTVYGIALR